MTQQPDVFKDQKSIPKLIFSLVFCPAKEGRWLLTCKAKAEKASVLAESPVIWDNYPGDEEFFDSLENNLKLQITDIFRENNIPFPWTNTSPTSEDNTCQRGRQRRFEEPGHSRDYQSDDSSQSGKYAKYHKAPAQPPIQPTKPKTINRPRSHSIGRRNTNRPYNGRPNYMRTRSHSRPSGYNRGSHSNYSNTRNRSGSCPGASLGFYKCCPDCAGKYAEKCAKKQKQELKKPAWIASSDSDAGHQTDSTLSDSSAKNENFKTPKIPPAKSDLEKSPPPSESPKVPPINLDKTLDISSAEEDELLSEEFDDFDESLPSPIGAIEKPNSRPESPAKNSEFAPNSVSTQKSEKRENEGQTGATPQPKAQKSSTDDRPQTSNPPATLSAFEQLPKEEQERQMQAFLSGQDVSPITGRMCENWRWKRKVKKDQEK